MEVTRIELPVKAGHRGRKPCEWHVDGFLIPKALTCSECERDKATTKDAFVIALTKKGIDPKTFVETYKCRSCRPKASKVSKAPKASKVSKAPKVPKVKVARKPKPPETVMVGKHELTRVELPVGENHRGRIPCEWYIGDFLIPRELTCCECEVPKATTKDQFVKLIEKSKLKPEKLVKKYICRSCRKSMRDNDEPVKIGKADESKVSIEEKKSLFETKKRSDVGMEIGLVVKRKPMVFHVLKSEFEQGNGLSRWAMDNSTEVYDLTRGLCLKHPKEKVLTDRIKHDSISKFQEVKTAFRLEDAYKVVKKMLNGVHND